MKAKTQYSDLQGTIAIDIQEGLQGALLSKIAQQIKLNEDKFRLVGFRTSSIDGVLSVLCEDKEKSKEQGYPYIIETTSPKEDLTIEYIAKSLDTILLDRDVANSYYENNVKIEKAVTDEDSDYQDLFTK